MRIVGHVTSEGDAQAFSDFLYVQGITNAVETDANGWAVWVHSEDEITRATDWLASWSAQTLTSRATCWIATTLVPTTRASQRRR